METYRVGFGKKSKGLMSTAKDTEDCISLNTMEEKTISGLDNDDETSLGSEVLDTETGDNLSEDGAQLSSSTNSSCEDPFRSIDSESNLIRSKKQPNSVELVLKRFNRPWVLLFTFFALAVLCSTTIALTYTMSEKTTSKVTALHGVVASDSEMCSAIARDILLQGGSAVDAAVAGTFCLGVMRPYASGLGGGGYMIVYYNQNETSQVIDFREAAPGAVTEDMFDFNLQKKDHEDNSVDQGRKADPMYIAVPGELRGLELAHSQYGLLSWKDVVLPSAKLARDGFIVDKFFAGKVQDNWDLLKSAKNFNMTSMFLIDGAPISEGQLFKQPALANTLIEIAYSGADAFYKGNIAKRLVADIMEAGGIITMEDMGIYNALLRPSQRSFYHGVGILSVPPSSAGGVAVSEIFNILERYNLLKEGTTAKSLQWTIEAFKHAFCDISILGDPDFINTTFSVATLSEKDYSSKIRRKILEDRTFEPSYYGIIGSPLSDMGSSSLVVVDSNRNAVALTTSLNYPFGSAIFSNGTGIWLNNQMASFTSKTVKVDNQTSPTLSSQWNIVSKSNRIEPHKRPLSSITPTILIRDGDVYMVVAASAGTETGQAMITAVVQTIIDIAGYSLDPMMAVTRSRCHHQLIPNKVYCENDYPLPLIEGLRSVGHEVVVLSDPSQTLGGVQLIVREDDGTLYGASDPRTNGKPAGY